jgi:hypothetical protein
MDWIKLHTRIWSDAWFRKLNTEQRLLFVHLIANKFCNLIKIYEYPVDDIAHYVDYSADKVTKYLSTFEADGKVAYIRDYVILANSSNYHANYNANCMLGATRAIRALPDEVAGHPLARDIIRYFMKDCPDYHIPVVDYAKPTPIVTETPKTAPLKQDTQSVFDYWNSKDIIKHTRLSDDIKRSIETALGSKKYTVAEIKLGIDHYNAMLRIEGSWHNKNESAWLPLHKFLKQSNGLAEWLDKSVTDETPETKQAPTDPEVRKEQLRKLGVNV